jgi:hypothetical protein
MAVLCTEQPPPFAAKPSPQFRKTPFCRPSPRQHRQRRPLQHRHHPRQQLRLRRLPAPVHPLPHQLIFYHQACSIGGTSTTTRYNNNRHLYRGPLPVLVWKFRFCSSRYQCHVDRFRHSCWKHAPARYQCCISWAAVDYLLQFNACSCNIVRGTKAHERLNIDLLLYDMSERDST